MDGLGRAQLTAAAAAVLDKNKKNMRWREVVALETSAASYEDLCEQVTGRPRAHRAWTLICRTSFVGRTVYYSCLY